MVDIDSYIVKICKAAWASFQCCSTLLFPTRSMSMTFETIAYHSPQKAAKNNKRIHVPTSNET